MKPWYEIKNAAGKPPELLLYGDIGEDFWGDGLSTGAKDIATELKTVGSPKSITVRINSRGGDVFEGQAIYSLLRSHPARIDVKVDGLAGSIASVIAMSGDTIEMPENAMMMLHEPSGMAAGTSEEMRKFADVLDKVRETIMAAYMTRANIDESAISGLMRDETWLTASEAVDAGLATAITPPMKIAACWDLEKSPFSKVPAGMLDIQRNQREAQGTPRMDAVRNRIVALQTARIRLNRSRT